MTTPGTTRLLITCDDRRGIIAAVTNFIGAHGGNIVEADQHTDSTDGRFAMRLEVEQDGFELDGSTFGAAFEPLVQAYRLRWRIRWAGEPRRRIVLLASREGHCVTDLIWRVQSGELDADAALVLSNHDDLRAVTQRMGVPFVHVPIQGGGRAEQEQQLFKHAEAARADLLVLARYMQILSPEFVEPYRNRIINIHHSFLPAFQGARPYHRAHDRGVKIIGATSHYVTADLDEGPIITQATTPVDHRDDVRDLVRKGRDLERIVLAEAVRLHLEDKVIVTGRRTIVFA